VTTLPGVARCVWIVAIGLLAALGGAPAKAAEPGAAQRDAQWALGQRIYREGIGATGEPLKALGAVQTVLTGKAVACATCHRRSGFGMSEGPFSIRQITATALFEEQSIAVHSPRIKAQLGTRQRPPYTEDLLARALRSGMDSDNKPLDPVMPRYALNDTELKAVTAYLATLSAHSSPGVDDENIHFATVIQPGVTATQRRAMLDIMQAFINDKNSGARSDEKRREAGNMRMYRSYRKWVLHVWDLSGPSTTWGQQLEALYSAQPVFALVGGLGPSSWQPIHDFSERLEIPSVFPQVDLPAVTGTNHYNFYFSRGLSLDAEVLAKFLRDRGENGPLLQVYRRDEAGLTASAAFRQALPPGTQLDDRVLDGPATATFWRQIAEARASAVVLWLGAQDVADAQPLTEAPARPVYLSGTVLGGKRPAIADVAGANVRLVYPTDLPPRHEARLLRTRLWLHNKGIALTDETVQVNTQFALTVLSDALGHIMDSFSRDFFAERIEHGVSQTPIPSMFPSVSLGPGQRFAAKGRSLVQLGDPARPLPSPLSGWIVP
jgi:hypothetical protein